MLERTDFREVLKANPLLAILRNVEDGKLEQYVQTVMDGGVSFFEVALNSKNALGQIRKLKEKFQGDILVGAGTVITEELAKNAVEAGADFLLSPSTDIQVLKYCSENQIAFLPGAMTPSEVTTCMSYGYRDIKLFPAGEMPMSYVKSLKGPLDGTEYVAIGVGLGSNMLPKGIVEREEWNVGTEYVRELVRKIGGVRS